MANVRVMFEIDTKDGQAKLTQLTGATEEYRKKTDQAKKTLGDLSVQQLASGLVTAGFTRLLFDSLRAQAASEQAINQLNLALANQGRFTEATSRSLQEYAAARASATTFDDEAILAVEAQLATYGMTEEQIKRTTSAVLDYAAATGKDLTSAAEMAGKAFLGKTAALGKLGIVVDENASKSAKFESVIKQLESRFGGSAAAATATFTGQMKQLDNAWGDAKEALGKLLGTMLQAQGQPMRGLIDGVRWLAKFFGQDLVVALGLARAAYSEYLAFIVGKIATVARFLSDRPLLLKIVAPGIDAGKLKAEVAFLEELRNGLGRNAEALREMSYQQAAAAGNTRQFANATHVAKLGSDELTKAEKELQKAAFEVGKEMVQLYEANQRAIAEWPYKWLAGEIEIFEKLGDEAFRLRKTLAAASTDLQTAALERFLFLLGRGSMIAASLRREMERTVDSTLRIADAVDAVGRMFERLGVRSESTFAKILRGYAEMIRASAQFVEAHEKGDLSGMVAGGAGWIGAFVGTIKSLFGGGGNAAKEALRDAARLRDEFILAAGGLDELRRRADEAGVSLDRLLLARTAEEAKRAIDELKGALAEMQRWLDLQGEAWRKAEDAAKRYGLSLQDLGPAFAKADLDKQARQVYEDFMLLTLGMTANIDTVATAMSDTINRLVQGYVRSGVAIPASLRPIIAELIRLHLLTDESGKEIEDINDLVFDEVTDSLKDLVSAVKDLVSALRALFGLAPPPWLNAGGGGGGGGGNNGGGNNGGGTGPDPDPGARPLSLPAYAAAGSASVSIGPVYIQGVATDSPEAFGKKFIAAVVANAASMNPVLAKAAGGKY